MKKIAIAVAHTLRGYGSGANGYLNESDESRIIVPLVVNDLNSLGYIAKEFRIDKENSYLYEDCYVRARMANEWGADLYVEIHLNSNPNESANGTEVYIHPKDIDAIKYAKAINSAICTALDTFDRTYGKGYKTEEFIVLSNTKMSAVLIEPLFCSNKSDSNKYTARKLADAIVKGLTGKLPERDDSKMDKIIGYTAVYDDNNGNKKIGSLSQGATVDVIDYWSTLSKIKYNNSFAYVDTSALESRAKKINISGKVYEDGEFKKEIGTANGLTYIAAEYSNAYKIYWNGVWGYVKKAVVPSMDLAKENAELKKRNKELEDKISKIKSLL